MNAVQIISQGIKLCLSLTPHIFIIALNPLVRFYVILYCRSRWFPWAAFTDYPRQDQLLNWLFRTHHITTTWSNHVFEGVVLLDLWPRVLWPFLWHVHVKGVFTWLESNRWSIIDCFYQKDLQASKQSPLHCSRYAEAASGEQSQCVFVKCINV